MVGFADGLQKGFGLVNDVYERRSKDQYRQEVIADRKAERKADEEYRERTFGLEEGQHQLKRDQFDQDVIQNAADRETQKVRNQTQDIINRKTTQALDANDAENERLAGIRKTRDAQNEAALAVDRILKNYGTAQTQEEYLAIAEDLKASYGTFLDAGSILDPIQIIENQVMLKQIQNAEAGETINDKAVANSMESLLGTSNKFRLGAEITEETHPNAPEGTWGKGFKIIESKVRNITLQSEQNPDFPNGQRLYLKPQVAVVMEDGEGKRIPYITDLTEHRSGTGAPARVYVDDFVKGFSAKMNLDANLESARPQMLEALKRDQFTDENGRYDIRAYETAKIATSTAIAEDIETRQMRDMPVTAGSTVTWGEFMASPEYDAYVENKLLRPDSSPIVSRDEIDFRLTQMREIPEIKEINQRRVSSGRPELDEIDLLKSQQYFQTQNGKVVPIKGRDYVNWYNKMSLRAVSNRFQNPSGYRADGQMKDDVGFLGGLRSANDSRRMTEVSIGVEIDGREMQIPTMVPTLTKAEINKLRNIDYEGNPDAIPESIKKKAVEHAKERLSQGLSPFYNHRQEYRR